VLCRLVGREQKCRPAIIKRKRAQSTLMEGRERKHEVHRVQLMFPESKNRCEWQDLFSSPYALDEYLHKVNQHTRNEWLHRPRTGDQFESAVLGHIERNKDCHFLI
jgi:hypothetical protein